jgi:hypothetical protein
MSDNTGHKKQSRKPSVAEIRTALSTIPTATVEAGLNRAVKETLVPLLRKEEKPVVKLPLPGNRKIKQVPSPVMEEDFYADPGLPGLPLKSSEVPTAEEMAEVVGVRTSPGLSQNFGDSVMIQTPLAADSPPTDQEIDLLGGDVLTPVNTVDRSVGTDKDIPYDALSVSSDVEDIKHDFAVLSTRLKDSEERVKSLSDEVVGLRYDVNTVSTQLGELVRLVERNTKVEQDIREREDRDEKLASDVTSNIATLSSLKEGIESVRKQQFTGGSERTVLPIKKMRKHRDE